MWYVGMEATDLDVLKMVREFVFAGGWRCLVERVGCGGGFFSCRAARQVLLFSLDVLVPPNSSPRFCQMRGSLIFLVFCPVPLHPCSLLNATTNQTIS
jgi:hypothetical protein